MSRFILFLSFFYVSLAWAKPALKLDSQLKKHYLVLLEQAVDFHKAVSQGSAQAIQTEIKETQEIIAKLNRQIPSVSQFHHRIHSHKLLKSIEEQLTALRRQEPLEEKRNVKKLFNSFFELAQVYDLKKDIKAKIFYCSKDKSLWFQKGGKANNPISPHYKNCGRIIL